MALVDQRRTARFPTPHEIVYNGTTVIYAPVYLDGALTAPTSGTVTVYNESNTSVISGNVTITGDIAQYSVAANTFASTDISERIRVVWALAGATWALTAENDGVIVGRLLYPVVTDADLFRRVASLDPSGAAPITARSNFQDPLDEAWTILVNRMIGDGFRPHWTQSPSSLREVHTALTLAIVFEDESTRLNPAYAEIAGEYRRQYEAAYRALTIIADADGDGIPEKPGRRRGVGRSSIWLGGS